MLFNLLPWALTAMKARNSKYWLFTPFKVVLLKSAVAKVHRQLKCAFGQSINDPVAECRAAICQSLLLLLAEAKYRTLQSCQITVFFILFCWHDTRQAWPFSFFLQNTSIRELFNKLFNQLRMHYYVLHCYNSHRTDRMTVVLMELEAGRAGCLASHEKGAWSSLLVVRNLILLRTVLRPSPALPSSSDSSTSSATKREPRRYQTTSALGLALDTLQVSSNSWKTKRDG